MKSSDIDKEILTALFDKILKSEEKTGSFKVSEETKKKFEEILVANTINTYHKNIDINLKKEIIFLKQKIIEFIRKQKIKNDWKNMNYLKLEEKEVILKDIINIETFIKFYYLVIKNITDKIQEYKRKGDKNNLLKNNILFLKSLKTKLNIFIKDKSNIKHINQLNNILNEIELNIDKAELNHEDFIVKHWIKIGNLSILDKSHILKNITSEIELLEFYNSFKHTFTVLVSKYKNKKNNEKNILINYLKTFYNSFYNLRHKIKNIEEKKIYKGNMKKLKYYINSMEFNEEEFILKYWKKRNKSSLKEKIIILNEINDEENLILFINQFEGNIENMTSRTLEKGNKKDISKLNNFFIELLQEIKKYELKINTKTIHKLEKNITKLTKNQ